MLKSERKQYIIDLSKTHSIVTPYTSFVAIEERKEGEDLLPTGPSITELLEKESVDILPYIDWENRIGEESEVKITFYSIGYFKIMTSFPIFRQH